MIKSNHLFSKGQLKKGNEFNKFGLQTNPTKIKEVAETKN